MTNSDEVRPKLIERLDALARDTGSTPDEVEAAARAYAEYQRQKAALMQEALDGLESGAPTLSHEEVWQEVWRILDARIANNGR